MRPRAGWGLWLATVAPAIIVFVLLHDRIENAFLRGFAALAIVAVGGVLMIAAVGAVRGLFDWPR